MWRGRFSDAQIATWLARFAYAADAAGALGDNEFDRVSCDACQTSFHRLVLDDAGISDLYSVWITPAQIEALESTLGAASEANIKYQRKAAVQHLLRLERFVDHGRPPRLLDFGCGDGAFVAQASLLGFAADGVDFSTTRHEHARPGDGHLYATLEQADEASGGHYDIVTAFEVIEHVVDPRQVLRDLCSRLVPGGIAVIETPDCASITVPTTFAEFQLVQPLEHVNTFTGATLQAIARRAGFEPLRVWPAFVAGTARQAGRSALGQLLRRRATSIYLRKR